MDNQTEPNKIKLDDCACECGHWGHFEDGLGACIYQDCSCAKYQPDKHSFEAEANRQLAQILERLGLDKVEKVN